MLYRLFLTFVAPAPRVSPRPTPSPWRLRRAAARRRRGRRRRFMWPAGSAMRSSSCRRPYRANRPHALVFAFHGRTNDNAPGAPLLRPREGGARIDHLRLPGGAARIEPGDSRGPIPATLRMPCGISPCSMSFWTGSPRLTASTLTPFTWSAIRSAPPSPTASPAPGPSGSGASPRWPAALPRRTARAPSPRCCCTTRTTGRYR